MSEVKEVVLDDEELFEQIHKEEMRNVPNRQALQSQVVSLKALGPAIVKFINHKLMNQGTKNDSNNKRSSNKKEKQPTNNA